MVNSEQSSETVSHSLARMQCAAAIAFYVLQRGCRAPRSRIVHLRILIISSYKQVPFENSIQFF